MQKPRAKGSNRPLFVAIIGGSGAGKSWLAKRLQLAFAPQAARLSLDDFYFDRSHLSPAQRARVNYDHPRAIDWPEFKRVLSRLSAGRLARVPVYDFATHCRVRKTATLKPAPLMLVDGLWLLQAAWLRRLFTFSIFLDAPSSLRLRRRLDRDVADRARSYESVRNQFWNVVEPMHRQYVQPQAGLANISVPHTCGKAQIASLARAIQTAMAAVNLPRPCIDRAARQRKAALKHSRR